MGSIVYRNSCDRPTGEVYVLNDGGEVDLDLGNYERYLNVTLSRDNNLTTGKIYREVIEKEVGWFLLGFMRCVLKWWLDSDVGIILERPCRQVWSKLGSFDLDLGI
jgi:hypothetical protein